MRSRKHKVPPCPPGLPDWAAKEWNDLEFADDKRAIAKELAELDRKQRRRAAEIGRIIAADFERERQQLLAGALRERAENLIDLKLAQMQEAIEADREESRRVFGAYVERVTEQFRNGIANAAKEREQVAKRLKKIEADMQKSRLHDERMELIRRGLLKGRRR